MTAHCTPATNPPHKLNVSNILAVTYPISTELGRFLGSITTTTIINTITTTTTGTTTTRGTTTTITPTTLFHFDQTLKVVSWNKNNNN